VRGDRGAESPASADPEAVLAAKFPTIALA